MPKTASKTKKKLNLKQEEFCKLFTGADHVDRYFFGNGTQCYIEVYEPEKVGNWYNTAKAAASRLLTNVNVIDRIEELLEDGGFNDSNVDNHHLFLINQFADFKSKMAAIKEYNQLKGRIRKPGDGSDNPLFVNFDPAFDKNATPRKTKGNSK